MKLAAEQIKTKDKAIQFARRNKNAIAKRETNLELYPSEEEPVSVFMAGSPGAGKTEASLELLATFSSDGMQIVRIDPDELRSDFEEYNGENSWLFQGAISILVDRILDLAFKQKQSFLLDGTLSNYKIAARNIERSLKRDRVVQILYVYQKPELAWEFVRAREVSEGRRVPPEQFIEQYFAAREVVNQLKKNFGVDLRVDLLLKNNDNTNRWYKAGIDQIDYHIPEKYDRDAIVELIRLN